MKIFVIEKKIKIRIMINKNNDIWKQKIKMSRKTFEIRQEREIYSLEIIKLLSGKKNSILIKTLVKNMTWVESIII